MPRWQHSSMKCAPFSAEELGGAEVHARTSGVVDHLAADDAHALAIARRIVATLNRVKRPTLDIAVDRLKECPEVRIVIGGHTDSVGTDVYNVDLSYRRAVATRDYLVRSGVDAARLGTEGFGEANPIAPNGSDDGRALNRRVELAPLP